MLRIRVPTKSLEKSLRFLCGSESGFNLLLRQKLDLPGAVTQRAIVSDTINSAGFALELIEDTTAAPLNNGVHPITDIDHLTLVVENTSSVLNQMKASGYESLIINELSAVIPVQNPSEKGGRSLTDQVALVRDLDGYCWQLMELKGTIDPPKTRIATIAIQVTHLETSLQWYCDVLGASVNERYEAKDVSVVHKSALIGWSGELEGTLLELRQAPQGTVASSSHSAQFVLATKDLKASMEAAEKHEQHCEIVELGSEEDPTQTVQAVKVTDPDGWEFYFVAK